MSTEQPTRGVESRPARGYLVKGADGEHVADAVRAVAAGQAVLRADVAERILSVLAAQRRSTRPGPFPMLNDREDQVLTLIANGSSNSDFARRLVVSEKTVRNHFTNIFAKLGVTDRPQAIVRARDARLGGC